MKNIGIYVHIPFCKQKCFYCDFCSYAGKISLQEKYVSCLIDEINSKKEVTSAYEVDTIYIGGGTPSVIEAKYIKQIIETIKEKYNVCKDCEITIEINPGTIDKEKITTYKNAGITRASIGLQSTNDRLLKEIGRIHTYKEFEIAYDEVRSVGIDNINVDLMIDLPNQSIEDVIDSVSKVIEKNPKHISVYSLIVEPGTKMFELIDSKKVSLPDEDAERKMYWKVKELLEKNGYNQYEISNFSKKGYESRHNLNCWNQQEYLGFGVAAHSYMSGVRYSNTCNIEVYISNISNANQKANITIHEKQTIDDMMREYMILGLRKIDGIDYKSFKKKFGKTPEEVFKKEISKLIEEELVMQHENRLKLTDKGLDFANIVWAEFV